MCSAERMHRFILRRASRPHRGAGSRRAGIGAGLSLVPNASGGAVSLAGRDPSASTRRGPSSLHLARDDFAIFPRDNEWFLGISLASQACALQAMWRTRPFSMRILRRLQAVTALGHAEGSIGVVDHYLGTARRELTRQSMTTPTAPDRAIAWLDEHGGRPWAAHARHDLADVLRQRDAPGDRRACRGSRLERPPASLNRSGWRRSRKIARFDRASPNSRGCEIAGATDEHVSTREGDYWAVAFGADSFRVRDSKGMHHLARLLRSPGQRDAFARPGPGDGSGAIQTIDPSDPELTLGDPSDTGPLLDAAAKAAYRERLSAHRRGHRRGRALERLRSAWRCSTRSVTR